MTTSDMTLIHLSDTHVQPEGGRLWNIVDGYQATLRAIDNIKAYGVQPDGFIISGDLVQDGDYEAGYTRFKSLLQLLQAEFDVPVLLSLGNHDEREPFQRIILGMNDLDPQQPYYHSHIIQGLKIISLDSLLPGQQEGGLDETQLAWLEAELTADPDMPKLLVLHHTPTTVVLGADRMEFQNVDQLADILRDKNIIGILTGHIHHAYISLFEGIPVVATSGIAFTVRHSYVEGKLDVLTGCGYNQIYVRDGRMYVNPIELPGDGVTAAWE